MQRRGFTLIELLVVIAIIAILAALLLPGLARARQQALGVQCLSHQKQLHLAWQLYADDNGRFVRNWDHGAGPPPSGGNWVMGSMAYERILSGPLSDATNTALLTDTSRTLLAKYLRTAGVFRCPADQSYALRGGVKIPRVRSYAMNGSVGESSRYYGDLHHYFRFDEMLVPGPAQTFVFLDEHEDSIEDGFFLVGVPSDRPFGWNEIPSARHRQGANFVFADGHAERHRWLDERTLVPVVRDYIWGLHQPDNPDVAWLHDHAYAPRQ